MGKKKVEIEDVLKTAPVVNEDGTPYEPKWYEKLDDWCFEHLWLYGYGYRIWKEYLCPTAIKRMVKFFFQRRIRGFDDSETWDLGDNFYKWIYPRLKRYTEISTGYPIDCKSHKEWIDTLTYRVKQLESFIDINEFDFNDWSYIPKKELEDLKKKKNIEDYVINATAYRKCVEDFNKWFSENVEQLWW